MSRTAGQNKKTVVHDCMRIGLKQNNTSKEQEEGTRYKTAGRHKGRKT